MRELQTQKAFLTTVLNELSYDGGYQTLPVKECYTGNTLFTIDLQDWSIGDIISREEYKIKYDGLANRVQGDLKREVPDWNSFRVCLWSSLALPPDKGNRKNIAKLINTCIAESRRGLGYTGQTAISLDTNLLYNRLLTRMFMDRERFGIEYDNCRDLMVLISRGCISEISNKASKKLSGNTNPQELLNLITDSRLSDSLFNKSTLQARKALNAQSEQFRMREAFSYYEADILNPPSSVYDNLDSDIMDQRIVRSLSAYSHENRIALSFLTNDDTMSPLLSSENIRYCIVHYPKDVPKKLTPGPWLLRELLYDLSQVYGVLELGAGLLRIEGVWKDKHVDDYTEHEALLLSLDENSSLGREILRDHKIMSRFQRSGVINLDKLS